MKPKRLVLSVATLTVTAVLLAPSALWPQRPAKKTAAKPAPVAAATTPDPKLKGVWERVSYPADLLLNDVFFVTPEIGWVTGGKSGGRAGGVLLHTRDGGATWSPQLGDAESAEPPFTNLHFLDERHGWALQGAEIGKYKLLRTTDAENWDQIGSIETSWSLLDYTFTSPNNGVFLDGNDNVARLMHTSDGGRTWTEVYRCPAIKLQIEGLTKEITCTFKSLRFPSTNVGYAVGGAHGAKRTLFVGKTGDGGKTWSVSTVSDIGGDLEVYFDQEVYFTDERTGLVHLSDKKLYRTTDGGGTWKGVIATPGPEIKFADAQVGWTLPYSSGYNQTLSYTVDGGKRWTSRPSPFPARVNAFSLPRRDRGYVVGEHGMIYRYRVLPPGEALAAKALAAPAMPVFDSPLDERVGELDQVVDALESAVAAAPDSAPAAGAAAATPEVNSPEAADMEETDIAADEVVEEDVTEVEVGAEVTETDATEVTEAEVTEAEVTEAEVAEAEVEETADAPAEGGTQSAFTAGCCAKPLGKFDLILAAVTDIVPQFLGQYKNTNLLLAGLRMVTDLPGRISKLNNALRTFRKAPDKAAAQARVAQVSAAVQGLSQSIAIAFQKQAPPSTEDFTEAGAVDVEEAQAEDAEIAPAEDGEAIPADRAEAKPAAEEPNEVDEAGSEAGEVVSESVQEGAQEKKQKAKEEVKKAIKKKLRF